MKRPRSCIRQGPPAGMAPREQWGGALTPCPVGAPAPPAWEGRDGLCPGNMGRRGRGDRGSSPSPSASGGGRPVPRCPMGNSLMAGGHKVPQDQQPGDTHLTGSTAKLCQHPRPSTWWCQSTPTCPRALPPAIVPGLSSRARGAGGSMLCPSPPVPHCLAPPLRLEVAVWEPPGIREPQLILQRGVEPYANEGLGDTCRAQHCVQELVLAASTCWGGPPHHRLNLPPQPAAGSPRAICPS